MSLNKLADVLARRGQAGDAEQALGHYQRSLEVSEGLLAVNPDAAQAARDVLVSLERLAQTLGMGGEDEQKRALECKFRALKVALNLQKSNPSSYFHGRTAAVSYLLASRRADAVGETELANECLRGCHAVLSSLISTGIELDPPMAELLEKLDAAFANADA